MVFSFAVTKGLGFTDNPEQGKKIDHIDIHRAFFNAPAKRSVFVHLPEEDQAPGMCGELAKSMCGTRDAALNWEAEYTKYLVRAQRPKLSKNDPPETKLVQKSIPPRDQIDQKTTQGEQTYRKNAPSQKPNGSKKQTTYTHTRASNQALKQITNN